MFKISGEIYHVFNWKPRYEIDVNFSQTHLYKFRAIPVKIPKEFSMPHNKLSLKFI